ncbi:uncharacterized protein KY384_006688 [Bacidia gigantensis]|uniref:uncharacterized protein n=1 Tax=Bacidia gigantensis TaxID=2732470 RepID=UPI001D04EC8A|nr:uncharacterized protein KY384_006688 [Bacidia gigantensis]KAG8528999.1 hypothetical protein KY384_006688 [Bacidia gigantensis]
MDGVSGVFAILSFSIQLVDSIHKARIFLREVHNAPEELVRLVDELDQFEELLRSAHGLIDLQTKISGVTGSIESVEGALRRCKSIADRLDASINKVQSYFNVRGRGRRTWASLKTVVKKDEIERLCRQIHDNKMNLQTALVINSSYIQLHQVISTRLPVIENEQNPVSADLGKPTSCIVDLGARPNKQMVKIVETDVWKHQTFFGHNRLRKKTLFVGTQREPVREERCLTISSSFAGMAFEMRYCGSFFQIPRSVTFYQIFDYWSTEWRSMTALLDDIEALKQALSQREVSPFAMNDWGQTLLHEAAIAGSAESCLLLIQIGVDPNHTDDSGLKAFPSAHQPGKDLEGIVRVFLSAQDDLSSKSVCSFVFNYFWYRENVDMLLSTYMSRYGDSDKSQNTKMCNVAFLRTALRNYGRGDDMNWRDSIRRWLCHWEDVHARTAWDPHCGTFTLLDDLFMLQVDPCQAVLDAQEWLLILTEAGYDVQAYLHKERELHSDQNLMTCPTPDGQQQRQLVFEINDNPRVYWDWWIDPLSSSSLVLQEFRYLNPYHSIWSLDRDDQWREVWPYAYPSWSENYEPGHDEYFEDVECWQQYDEWCQDLEDWRLWKGRVDNVALRHARQARKKYSSYYGDYDEKASIPGAWPEKAL